MQLKRRVATIARRVRKSVHSIRADYRHNRKATAPDGRILVLRHLSHPHPLYNAPFLAWMSQHRPDLARRLELRRPFCRIRDWERYSLFVPWLQDPLKELYPADYRQARRLERQCEERGIPVVNPVDRLSVSIKSVGAELLKTAGLRTPRMVPITNVEEFRRRPSLPPPFFVRENLRHGGPMLLVRSPDELRALPLEGLEQPVAVEFIDVRGPDGLYRKYRYCLFGDHGVPRHLVISEGWVVHAAERVVNERTVAEELEYVTLDADPNHKAFLSGRRALGLDSVAFDYAYDQEGSLVVFEANPFPVLWLGGFEAPTLPHMRGCGDRLFSTLARFLNEKADGLA